MAEIQCDAKSIIVCLNHPKIGGYQSTVRGPVSKGLVTGLKTISKQAMAVLIEKGVSFTDFN